MPLPTLTVKLSGSLITPRAIGTLARSIEQAGPHRLAIVHGGGPQLDEALARLGEPVAHRQGLRVTSRQQAGIVQATLETVGAELSDGLAAAGIPATHVSSLEQRLVAKIKHLDDGTTLGRVGTPVAFRTSRLGLDGSVPVITPVGHDASGPLNVNADEAAAAVASATGSSALVLATGVPGVLDADGDPLASLTPAEAAGLLEDGTAAGGMQPKLEAAITALGAGVDTVHVGPLTEDVVGKALAGAAPGTLITDRREVLA